MSPLSPYRTIRRARRWLRIVIPTALALLLLSTPASAFIIFLKDGKQIVAREKYTVEGDQAVFQLPNGVRNSLPLAEIDIPKTTEINASSIGQGRLIEGLEQRDLIEVAPPPPEEQKLSDAIARREQRRAAQAAEAEREAAALADEEGGSEASLPRTTAGYVDLSSWQRIAYDDADVATTLESYLNGQGIEGVNVYRGTRAQSPFLEVIVASSEASVFKAIKESANALIQIRDRYPAKVDRLELLLLTGSNLRAGQFSLTPDQAESLATGQVDPAAFFLRNVEF